MGKLRQKTLDMIELIKNLMAGRTMSLREIYYEAEAKQLIKGGKDDYNNMKYALREGRRRMMIDPGSIEDPTREPLTYPPTPFTAPQVIAGTRRGYLWYKRNYWDDQANYIEVWVEKVSLCKYFMSDCREYGIILVPCKGDQGWAAIWEAKLRFDKMLSKDKIVKVLYFGDFNPSGVHAPTAIQNTLANWNTTGIEFKRIALMFEDIEKYNLPPNPTKKTSKKDVTLANRFIKEYGEDYNVELDAFKAFNLPEFKKRIRESIEAEIDPDLKKITDDKDARGQRRLKKLLGEKLVW